MSLGKSDLSALTPRLSLGHDVSGGPLHRPLLLQTLLLEKPQALGGLSGRVELRDGVSPGFHTFPT